MSGFLRVLTGVGVALCLVTATVAGPLPDVAVTVVDRTGTPLAGASVCLGTWADHSQFGALLTDANGIVVFNEIPRTALVLTVSKLQYTGYRRDDVPSESNRILAVSLHSGGLGPVCEGAVAVAAPVDTGEAGSGFVVRNFRINKGEEVTADRSVQLSAKVAGRPTHYRASENADFRGADWQNFDTLREFELSRGAGAKTVYFQVRRYMEIDGAVLQSLSNVSSGSISLVSNN